MRENWYVWCSEYPEEGSEIVEAETAEEAIQVALAEGFFADADPPYKPDSLAAQRVFELG